MLAIKRKLAAELRSSYELKAGAAQLKVGSTLDLGTNPQMKALSLWLWNEILFK